MLTGSEKLAGPNWHGWVEIDVLGFDKIDKKLQKKVKTKNILNFSRRTVVRSIYVKINK